MRLEQLRLRQFRNLDDADLGFPASGVALLGDNGQGKTNLLEAIYYPVFFRSIHGAGDTELVRFGTSGFRVDAEVSSGNRHHRIAVAFHTAGRRKQIERDGVAATRLADEVGHWLAVAFLPQDLRLTAGPAAERRRYLDRMLAVADRGYYSALAKPVLRIASGDIVEVETLLTSTPSRLEAAGVPPARIESSLRAITDSVTDKGPGGHILTGPIYVDGAQPGDVLEVRILGVGFAIEYGYNGCSGFLRELCGEQQRTRIIALDTVRRVADLGSGISVPLRPFFGSMGVAPPPDSGRVSSNPPGSHAGNLDNKELVAGTTLFIPVHVAGALFEVGDGHAAQGDGEVDQTAIETSLRGRLQLVVRKDLKLMWPRAETPTHMIVMGTDTSLTVATRIAVREMVAYLMEAKGLAQMEAYRLASIAADLHITQLVDGRVGVHMMIPKAVLGAGQRSGSAPGREAPLDPAAPLRPR